MYQFQNLENSSLLEISQCLNIAFSDYAIPIQLSEQDLAELFTASGIDRSLSFGAFFEGQLVGCMLNSQGIYQGHRAAFDVATGMIPEHRGKGAFAGLLALAKETMKQHQIEQYYLEVLQQNEPAVSLYQRHGFTVTREFAVFSGRATPGKQLPERVQYVPFSAFEGPKTDKIHQNVPSYEHADSMLRLCPDLYEVAYIKEQEISAWCVYKKETGQIVQLGWERMEDLQEIVQWLLVRYSAVTVKNIDFTERQLLEMLATMPFQIVATQYEMVYCLDETATDSQSETEDRKCYKFQAQIEPVPDKGGAYVRFPYDIRKEFGKGRVKAEITFDGEPYSGSIVNMGIKNEDGSVCYIIGVRKDIRKKIGKQPGDTIEVTVKVTPL